MCVRYWLPLTANRKSGGVCSTHAPTAAQRMRELLGQEIAA